MRVGREREEGLLFHKPHVTLVSVPVLMHRRIWYKKPGEFQFLYQYNCLFTVWQATFKTIRRAHLGWHEGAQLKIVMKCWAIYVVNPEGATENSYKMLSLFCLRSHAHYLVEFSGFWSIVYGVPRKYWSLSKGAFTNNFLGKPSENGTRTWQLGQN